MILPKARLRFFLLINLDSHYFMAILHPSDNLHSGKRKIKIRGQCFDEFFVCFALGRRGKNADLVLPFFDFLNSSIASTRMNFYGQIDFLSSQVNAPSTDQRKTGLKI